MNEQQNVNNSTPPKPKKKRSFWWLKLLLILILLAIGFIGGMLLTSQHIVAELRDEILDEFFPQYHYAMTEVIEAPAPTALPSEKPIEYKVSPTPAPKASKAPVEIISPEQQEKAESKENEAAAEESAAPEASASPAPFELAGPLPTAEAAFGPAAGQDEATVPVTSNEYIGIDAALEAALKHAQLEAAEVFVYSVSRERDDGLVYYNVEFGYEGRDYEYEINAFSGVVESWKTERADREDTAVAAASADTLDVSAYVSVELAKSAALEHAGYTEYETKDMKTSLEIENNKLVYDVEFRAEGYEYDYKVDAVTGSVFMVEKERG